MDFPLYDQSGKEVSKVTIPERIFGLPWNADLVHEAAETMLSNARISIASTKGRRDVSGGGRKPWRQKGTGRARHGSRRSPLWRGGGITFGPTNERNFSKKLNRKAAQKAFLVILSQKLRDGEILFVDKLSLDAIKTSAAKKILDELGAIHTFESLASKKKNTACITLTKSDDAVFKSFRNFNNIYVTELRNLNLLDLLRYKFLIIVNPEASINFLESKLSNK